MIWFEIFVMVAVIVCMGAMGIQLRRKLDKGYRIDRKASKEVKEWAILSVAMYEVALIMVLIPAFVYECSTDMDIWSACGFLVGFATATTVYGTYRISEIKDSLSPAESPVIEDNGQDESED